MHAVIESPRVESFALKSSPRGYNTGQHHRPVTRRSLKDLPGGIRVPVLKKSDRLKSKLEASLAGLQELHALREKHQLLVTQAKTSLHNPRDNWSSAFNDFQEKEIQSENDDLSQHQDGFHHANSSTEDYQKERTSIHHETLQKTVSMDTRMSPNTTSVGMKATLPMATSVDTRTSLPTSATSMDTDGSQISVKKSLHDALKEGTTDADAKTMTPSNEAKASQCVNDENSKTDNETKKESKLVDMSYKECNVNVEKLPEEKESLDGSGLLRSKSSIVCQLSPEQKSDTKSSVDLNRTMSSGTISRSDSLQSVPLKRKDSILAGVDITSQGPNPVHAILMAYSPSFKSHSMSSLGGSLSRSRNSNSPTISTATLCSKSDNSSTGSCGSVFSDRTTENEGNANEMTCKSSERTTRTVLRCLDSVSKKVSQSTQTIDKHSVKSETLEIGYTKQHSARKGSTNNAGAQTPPCNKSSFKDRSPVDKTHQGSVSRRRSEHLLDNDRKLTHSASSHAFGQKDAISRVQATPQNVARYPTTPQNTKSNLTEFRRASERPIASGDNSKQTSRTINSSCNNSTTPSPTHSHYKSERREDFIRTRRELQIVPNQDHRSHSIPNQPRETFEQSPHGLSKYSQSAIALSPMIQPDNEGYRDCNKAKRVPSLSPAKRTVNCDISGTNKVRRFGMPLDSKLVQSMLKRQEQYQPLHTKLPTKPIACASSSSAYENIQVVGSSRQSKSLSSRTKSIDSGGIEHRPTPLSPTPISPRLSDSEDGQMILLESYRLATSTPVISKKWANSSTKLSFASDEGYFPSPTSTPKTRRHPTHKPSLRSNVTCISTDLDESDLSPQGNINSSSPKENVSSFSFSRLPPSSGQWEDSLDNHRIISPSRSTRDWDTCSFRSSVSMLSLPIDVQESAI